MLSFQRLSRCLSSHFVSPFRSASSLLSAQEFISSYNSQFNQKKIHAIDASWHLQGNRNGDSEFLSSRIRGAQRFNIDQVADLSSPLPHMLPSAEQFSAALSKMGINRDDTVVVYATKDALGGARCWWTFKCFGHEDVRILNGGLPSYIAEGGEIESGDITLPKESNYHASFEPEMVKNWQQVLESITTRHKNSPTIIDARSEARFYGRVAEPRPGVASGHIPNSICVHFNEVIQDNDPSQFKTIEEISEVFKNANVDVHSPNPIITTCGSGVTACILTFALHLLGRDPIKSPVYDGSWSEWGTRSDLPITI